MQLLDTLNSLEDTAVYKGELQRIYNLLMAVVVNDKEKSKSTSQLLGQGFNRLCNGVYDEYFIQQGVPFEWYESKTGNTLANEDFEEQQLEFEEADQGLRWQWFSQIEDDHFFTVARGTYVAKIDITAGWTDENQAIISQNARISIFYEKRMLAQRAQAASKIVAACKEYSQKKRTVRQE